MGFIGFSATGCRSTPPGGLHAAGFVLENRILLVRTYLEVRFKNSAGAGLSTVSAACRPVCLTTQNGRVRIRSLSQGTEGLIVERLVSRVSRAIRLSLAISRGKRLPCGARAGGRSISLASGSIHMTSGDRRVGTAGSRSAARWCYHRSGDRRWDGRAALGAATPDSKEVRAMLDRGMAFLNTYPKGSASARAIGGRVADWLGGLQVRAAIRSDERSVARTHAAGFESSDAGGE